MSDPTAATAWRVDFDSGPSELFLVHETAVVHAAQFHGDVSPLYAAPPGMLAQRSRAMAAEVELQELQGKYMSLAGAEEKLRTAAGVKEVCDKVDAIRVRCVPPACLGCGKRTTHYGDFVNHEYECKACGEFTLRIIRRGK